MSQNRQTYRQLLESLQSFTQEELDAEACVFLEDVGIFAPVLRGIYIADDDTDMIPQGTPYFFVFGTYSGEEQ